MNDQYEIRFRQDNIYAVYPKGKLEGDYIYKGTLEEINAWLDLKAKGFDI